MSSTQSACVTTNPAHFVQELFVVIQITCSKSLLSSNYSFLFALYTFNSKWQTYEKNWFKHTHIYGDNGVTTLHMREWGDPRTAEIYFWCVYEPSAHSCQSLPLHHFELKTTSLHWSNPVNTHKHRGITVANITDLKQ